MTQNLKIRAYIFEAKFYRASHEKIYRSQNSDIWVWGLKTNLGQFGPKAFDRGLIKPLVENPSSNFHKQDIIFSKMINPIKS